MDNSLVLEQQGTVIDMPVGSLGEGKEKVYLYFNHAYSFEEAKLDFERRRNRINMDNLFIKMQYGWGEYSEDVIRKYDNLHCGKKIFIAPFQSGISAEVRFDYFQKEWSKRNLEGIYQPRDFKAYTQNIGLMAREYNIIHMLLTGEAVKRVI